MSRLSGILVPITLRQLLENRESEEVVAGRIYFGGSGWELWWPAARQLSGPVKTVQC